ncbi:hypothetical protein Bbelb_342980 [Branchiostoma belcheri]|nr:hypothetical protein Bbelb_342980 [Branchiostoma belcheri]
MRKERILCSEGRIAQIHGKVNRTSVRLTDTSLSLRAMANRGLPSVHLLTQPTFRHTPVHNVRTTQPPPPRVTEHWNDPVRNALLRDFGTCYPVVNVPRALVASAEWNSALAIQCGERPPSSGKRVLSGSLAPENECRVKIQLWNSSPDGVSALEQSRFCTRIPVRSFLPHRAPSADATFPLSSALAAVCPAGYRPLVGTCIRLVSQELSHDGARLACLEDGAILAMPKTRELDVALRELVRTNGGNEDYWIGMWEGTGYTDWQWMDGSQLHTYDYQQRVKGCLKSISPPVPVERWLNIESLGHTVDLEAVRILDTEQDYFKRGIKEAIYIRALQPSLNRDGGRYRLQTTFDPLLTSHVGIITCPQHAWNPGEPSNVDWLLWDNCVQYWSEPTGYPLWDDADCFYYKRYICQAARL